MTEPFVHLYSNKSRKTLHQAAAEFPLAAKQRHVDDNRQLPVRVGDGRARRVAIGVRDGPRQSRSSRHRCRRSRRRTTRRYAAAGRDAAERQLSFHQTVQLQLRLLLSHGQNVVRAAAGRGQARADHAGRGGHEEAELLGRRTVHQGRRPVHGRADPVLQDRAPVGRHQRIDRDQRQPDSGVVDAPVRRPRGHVGRVVRLVRRGHEQDDRAPAGRAHRPRGQAVRGARVVRPAQDRVQNQHGGERVQRARAHDRAH